MRKYSRYLIFGVFIIAILLIVVLQFNSSKAISSLIATNEKLPADLEIKAGMQKVRANILNFESKSRGLIITGKYNHPDTLNKEALNVKLALAQLDSFQFDKSIQPLIKKLDTLAKAKLRWQYLVLDSLRVHGRPSLERLISTRTGSKLTDSITATLQQIEDKHELTVKALIAEADSTARKARALGLVMGVFAAMASIFIFIYISYKIIQQERLIDKLHVSEDNALKAIDMKRNFLANVSHEMRTPLNAIIGFTNLLRRRSLGVEEMEYVKTIQHSGERLLLTINDLLDLSKIEAGMMQIELTPFGLNSLVHSIEVMFAPKADEKNIHLVTTIDSTIPDILEGDTIRLSQVLINLVSNAIKFTHEGKIEMRFENEGITNNIVNVAIIVSDTGIGIEQDKLDKIFERFQQAEDSVTRKFGGTGLGLSIVKEIVRLQNGTVTAQSTIGKGTIFTVRIPYIISKLKPEEVANDQHNTIIESDFSGVKILVAEDNEINQSLLKHLFNNWNLKFDIVENGLLVLDKLKQHQYDLVLMDIQMPEMDGYTATQEIRNTLRLQTPVIAMTAHALAGEREKCLSFGMNEYISKPLKEQQLKNVIERFTNKEAKNVVALQKPQVANQDYEYINLQYMKEISMGDVAYEKIVTEQFIDQLPSDMIALQKAWEHDDLKTMRRLAHDMKSTIAVMGLNEKLNPLLDELEYKELNNDAFNDVFKQVKLIGSHAVKEAHRFYTVLS